MIKNFALEEVEEDQVYISYPFALGMQGPFKLVDILRSTEVAEGRLYTIELCQMRQFLI